jgi:hypothetical protein
MAACVFKSQILFDVCGRIAIGSQINSHLVLTYTLWSRGLLGGSLLAFHPPYHSLHSVDGNQTLNYGCH